MSTASLRRLAFALAAALLQPAAAAQPAPPPPPPADGGTLVLPVPPSGTPAERQQWLVARIDEILTTPALAGARIGVAITEVDSGKILYDRQGAALFNPASNVKLVTTAAGLALLGPEFRWKTVLFADPIHRGTVEGNLYLQGSGDPSLVSEDLWKMVSDLAATGVKRVSGDLVIDDTYFDDVRVGPGFDQKKEHLPFRAPNGAVSLNYNACSIHVLPGARAGGPARIVIDPASPYFSIVNDTRTVADGQTRIDVLTHEAADHYEITVSGRIRASDPPLVEYRRIPHPDLYTGHALRELLVRRGIKLGGTIRRGAASPSARPVAAHTSQPLGVLVRDVNKRSNNFMAEQLLKTLGAEIMSRPGTWTKGVDAVSRFLDRLGIPRDQYKMLNGSGLYDTNRFSPLQIASLLRTAYRDFRFAADFVGSLALAGADGTIGHRMEGSPAARMVRAKTGTLAGVSCLSGYAGGPGRLPLAFSILMNGLTDANTADARRAQDLIAETLVAFLGAK